MSRSGALDLATGVGGKLEKKDVKSAVDQYDFPLFHSHLFCCFDFLWHTCLTYLNTFRFNPNHNMTKI